MLRRLLLSLSLITFALGALAQSGTIKGHVKDAVSGDAIIGANVLVKGTALGAVADIEGNFEIPKVKAGTYSLVVSFISYKTDTLQNITVYPDQTTVINHGLIEEGQELNEVVITGARVTNTDLSVVTEIRKSDLVAVGISAQQITMSQDRDAAQIMKRLPGVTIMNNRFVNVRGLSERYSTVMLNGIIAPSTEVDSKAFAFDLIPSNMIDRVLVYKSGSPELPGEFAGADIGIYTKSTVEENSVTLSVSGSFRANTTGKTVSLDAKKYSMDWLGGNGGNRALPSSFPSNLRVNTQEEINRATEMLPNTWATRTLTASPDYRVNLDVARTMRLAGKRLDNITSISYAHTNQRIEVTQNYYDAFSETTQKSTLRYHYNDLRFAQTNRLGAISNFTLELDPSNKIEFRNFYNQQGQNQSTFRTGTDNAQFFDVNNMALNYYARSIYSGQLSGKHAFSDAVNFNWILGYNNTNANQPDYRRIRSQRDMGTDEPFSVVIPPGASSFEAGRFYSKLKEDTYSAVGNLEIKLNPSVDDEQQTKITAGYYAEQKNRAFSARWMSYKWATSADVDNSLLLQPFDQIFTPQNLISKFVLEEGTNIGPSLYDRYDGHNTLLAGYVGLVKPFADKFRFSGGLRVEYNVQKIDVYDVNNNGHYVKRNAVDNPVTVPMPFANLTYNITEKMLIRLAYSKTVNRPVFRELAPFNFYDFDRNADISGNTNLKTAKIDNVDLRWELYPSKADNISFGVFYKHFKDPIEQYLRPGSNLIYNFGNADKATTYGVEAEIRKSFTDLSSPFLNKLSVVFNGALIKSQVVFPDISEYNNLEKKRAMQGQSPYVVNASLYYNNFENGLQVSIQYNVFGKRLYAVGDKDSNANQYEMPRNQVDFTVSKELNKHFELKLGVQDILNQKYRLIQDSNRDKKITGVDEPIQTYRWGQYGTLGVVWKL
ncbi:MAG TPA: TonB-dependent receptor [Ohtaekwangia sp.]|uniref:TonB-dependent receptor n=1 Tax=Ohtaekwangia sp. TaxID=2066019 RepID=UPI002F91FD74